MCCSRSDKVEFKFPAPPVADEAAPIAAAAAEPTKAGIVTAADIKAKEAKVTLLLTFCSGVIRSSTVCMCTMGGLRIESPLSHTKRTSQPRASLIKCWPCTGHLQHECDIHQANTC